LEQHADSLPSLRDAVEAAVEVEILQRRQLPVHERLVREESDLRAIDGAAELAGGRRREARAQAEQRRLPGTVRTSHKEEAARVDVKLDAAQHAPLAKTLLEPAGANHGDHSTRRYVHRPAVPKRPTAETGMSGTVPVMSLCGGGSRHKSVNVLPQQTRSAPSAATFVRSPALPAPSCPSTGSFTSAPAAPGGSPSSSTTTTATTSSSCSASPSSSTDWRCYAFCLMGN